MEEIARVYSEALFDVAKEKETLDEVHEQLGEIADAVDNRQATCRSSSSARTSPRARSGTGSRRRSRAATTS